MLFFLEKYILKILVLFFLVVYLWQFVKNGESNKSQTVSTATNTFITNSENDEFSSPIRLKWSSGYIDTTGSIQGKNELLKVFDIIDGDTIDVTFHGKIQRIRFIGVDAPESTTLRNGTIECFGNEAKLYLQNVLSGKLVRLELDSSQGEFDKYNRLLSYVFLDNININKKIIKDGYGYEYTYSMPYKYQKEFKDSQKFAEKNNLGLWSPNKCNGERMPSTEIRQTVNRLPELGKSICNIKGNISFTNGEKIYHLPSCESYTKTKVNLEKGEKRFCSEKEAIQAGWRKARNCK